jgi:hypothetical protein
MASGGWVGECQRGGIQAAEKRGGAVAWRQAFAGPAILAVMAVAVMATATEEPHPFITLLQP